MSAFKLRDEREHPRHAPSLFSASVEIPLRGKHGRGKRALVSPADADLAKLRWHDRNGYASSYRLGAMHSIVCKRAHGPRPSPRHQVDHANRNTLDNRRENLRWANRRQQARNRAAAPRGTAKGMRGVGELYRADGSAFYQPRLYINSKTVALGSYDCAETAGRVYDAYASRYYGAFAVLNFPEDEPWSLDECERQRLTNSRQTTWAKPAWVRLNAITGQSFGPSSV